MNRTETKANPLSPDDDSGHIVPKPVGDELISLRRQNARLREALGGFLDECGRAAQNQTQPRKSVLADCMVKARQALSGGHGGESSNR